MPSPLSFPHLSFILFCSLSSLSLGLFVNLSLSLSLCLSLPGLGLTGVPVFNINNNCSSGSTALMLARSLVIGGMSCVLAVGEESFGLLLRGFNDSIFHSCTYFAMCATLFGRACELALGAAPFAPPTGSLA